VPLRAQTAIAPAISTEQTEIGQQGTPYYSRFLGVLSRFIKKKDEIALLWIRHFLHGKDLIQLGTVSIPNPDGGVKINY
jgi:hypothetical protein